MEAMASPDRFVDDGKSLASFADTVYVKCARCHHSGVVKAQWTAYRWIAVFSCSSCDLQLASERGDWVGPVTLKGRRPCGYCGHKWLQPSQTQESWPRSVVERLDVECPECKRVTSVPVVATARHTGDEAIDPHFGQPLLLVDNDRHGSLWAYNLEHLDELRRYVAATLRERSANAGNKSMASRLPSWIKLAKNRASILKRIARLAAAA